MDFDDLVKLVMRIGTEVCDDCDDERDCGLNPNECARILEGVDLLEEYIDSNADNESSEGNDS